MTLCGIDLVEPESGYVYIIRAQDAYDDRKRIKAEAVKFSEEHSVVKVYSGRAQEKPYIIMVTVVRDNGQWKIDNVSDFSAVPYRFR